jgi:hypothetical protein
MNNTLDPIIEPIMKLMGYGTIPEINDPRILEAELALAEYPEHLKMWQKFRDQPSYPELLLNMKQYLDQCKMFNEYKQLVGCGTYFFKDHLEIHKLLGLICDLFRTIETNLPYNDPTVSLQNFNILIGNGIQTFHTASNKLGTLKQFIADLDAYNVTPAGLYGESLTPVINAMKGLSDENYGVLIDFVDQM